MRSSYLLITLIFLIGSTASSRLVAQHDLEAFIERDSAAFIVIQDPESILLQIESSVFFQNSHFLRALELMVDGEFPLAQPERLIELEAKWNEIRNALKRFDEVSLIIHSWSDDSWSIPKISIAFAGPPESIQTMERLLADVKSSILNSGAVQPDFFSLVAANELSGVSIQQAGNLVLLSNAPEKSKELMTRLEQSEDKKFKSLARNRSYLQVQKLLEKRAKSPQVRGFLAPRSFRRLITRVVAGDQFIMIDPPESIASAGFQILLQSESEPMATPDATYQPAISWDFVLTYTQPVSGFGKLIESFEPLTDFPSLPYSITSLKAIGFDLKAKHQANREIFEKYQKHLFAPISNDDESGTMSFENYFSFSEFGMPGMTDELKMNLMLETTSGAISVFHEENPIHWKAAIEIKKVKNREAMEKLLAHQIKTENHSAAKNARLVEIPNDYGQLFGRTQSGIREHLQKRATALRDSGEEVPEDFAPQEGEPLSDKILSRQYEYFINDDWMIHCDHNSMKQFLSAVYEEPVDPGTFELLLKATKHSSGQSSFFKIDYQSHRFYQVKNKRNQNSIESARIREKHGIGPRDWSPKVWKKLMSEPDEYGLRIEIESTADAAAAVQQLIVHAFNDSFGTIVSLYSRENHKMRIFGQVYSLVDELVIGGTDAK